MSYLDSGYNKYLRRVVVEDEGLIDQLTNIDQEVLTPPQSIDSSNVKTITMDKITGGELVVGGVGNERGSITIRDGNGVEIVTLDNRGITTL